MSKKKYNYYFFPFSVSIYGEINTEEEKNAEDELNTEAENTEAENTEAENTEAENTKTENTEKETKYFTYRYRNSVIVIILSLNRLEVLWETQKRTIDDFYEYEGFKAAVRMGLILHMLYFNRGIIQKLVVKNKIKFYADSDEEKIKFYEDEIIEQYITKSKLKKVKKLYPDTEIKPVISSIIEEELSLMIPDSFHTRELTSKILTMKDSKGDFDIAQRFDVNLDYRIPALYSYLYAKSKDTEFERFLFFWMSLAAILNHYGSDGAEESSDRRGLLFFTEKFSLKKEGEKRKSIPGIRYPEFSYIRDIVYYLFKYTDNLSIEDFKDLTVGLKKLNETYYNSERFKKVFPLKRLGISFEKFEEYMDGNINEEEKRLKRIKEWMEDFKKFKNGNNDSEALKRMRRFFVLELPYYYRNKFFHLSKILPIFDSVEVVIIGALRVNIEDFLDRELPGILLE